VPGDLTNDLRVTVNDGGALASLLGTSPIDPLNPFHVRADINRDGSVTSSDMSLLLGQIGVDLRFVPTTCIDLGGEEESEPVKKSPVEPTVTDGIVAVVDGAFGQNGPPQMAAAESGDAPDSDGEANVMPVLLGRQGGITDRGLLHLDLLAVRAKRMESLDPESPEADADAPLDPTVVAAIFGLVTYAPSLDEAAAEGWRFVRIPEPFRGPAATETLAALLRGEGLSVAPVISRDDGMRFALTDDIRLTRRATIPASWCERVVPGILGRLRLNGSLVHESDMESILVVDDTDSIELVEVIRLLAARREFELVAPELIPLGLPVVEDLDGPHGVEWTPAHEAIPEVSQ
jgi:hypothetical protein